MRLAFQIAACWMAIACTRIRAGVGGTSFRSTPASVEAGGTFAWTNQVIPAPETIIYVVEETLPGGWAATNLSHGGLVDQANHKLKWGPFFDSQPRTLTASITVPPNAKGRFPFVGVVAFGGDNIVPGGTSNILVIPLTDFGTVVRALPQGFAPGVSFPLTNFSTPAPNVSVYAVEDTLPSGWIASEIGYGGEFDPASSKVKWGPFFDAIPRTLTCLVTPPMDSTDVVLFSGLAAFDGTTVPIGGDSSSLPLSSRILRSLPESFVPNQPLTVSLVVSQVGAVSLITVQESPPVGWTVSNISDNGVYDPATQSIKWGPLAGDTGRTIRYTVLPPLTAQGSVAFSGIVYFDNDSGMISGDLAILGPVNNGNRVAPASVLATGTFMLLDRVQVVPSVGVYWVEEVLPVGWNATNLSHGGIFNSSKRVIHWGPFFDTTPRELSCLVTVGSQSGTNLWQGTLTVDNNPYPINGASQINVIDAAAASGAIRQIPGTARAGGNFELIDTTMIATNATVWVAEELLPSGWVPSFVSDGGVFDATTSKIKWGPFFDASSRTVRCTVSIPASANLPASISGQLVVDGTTLPIGGPSTIIPLPNHPPLAPGVTVYRYYGQPLLIPTARLLANTSDPDGDSISLVEITATSATGLAVQRVGNQVVFAAGFPFHGSSTFTYTIIDAYGSEATGSIYIVEMGVGIRQDVRLLAVAGDGVARIRLGGLPGINYQVQASDTLGTNGWTGVGSGMPGLDGYFDFIDRSNTKANSRYYRSVAE